MALHSLGFLPLMFTDIHQQAFINKLIVYRLSMEHQQT